MQAECTTDYFQAFLRISRRCDVPRENHRNARKNKFDFFSMPYHEIYLQAPLGSWETLIGRIRYELDLDRKKNRKHALSVSPIIQNERHEGYVSGT